MGTAADVPAGAGPVELVATILDCAPGDLDGSERFGQHAKWDSFAHLEIMIALSDRYGVEITEESIEKYGHLAEIIKLHNDR